MPLNIILKETKHFIYQEQNSKTIFDNSTREHYIYLLPISQLEAPDIAHQKAPHHQVGLCWDFLDIDTLMVFYGVKNVCQELNSQIFAF